MTVGKIHREDRQAYDQEKKLGVSTLVNGFISKIVCFVTPTSMNFSLFLRYISCSFSVQTQLRFYVIIPIQLLFTAHEFDVKFYKNTICTSWNVVLFSL